MRLHPVDAMLYLSMRLCKALDRRETDLSRLDAGSVRSILAVSSTAIGDTLLSTPAIRAVRERYPRARIVALLNRDNMELFENNPHVDGIVPFHGGYKRFFRTVRRLRGYGFDLALIFHGNEPQATPLAYLSGARYVVKIPNTNEYRFLLSNRDPVLTWEDFPHGVDQRLGVAELAGCRPVDRRMVLPPAADQEAPVERFLREEGVGPDTPLVGFQVAASTVSRMWFAEQFVELGQRLSARFPDARIVITGSPGEARYGCDIAAAIGGTVIVAAGRLRLVQLPWLVRRFRLLVTGDTGIMHLAIAVGTPVVALFAAADARKSGPYYDNDRHTVIQTHRTCNPCLGKRCPFQWCMANISVEDVFSAAAKILETPEGGRFVPTPPVFRDDPGPDRVPSSEENGMELGTAREFLARVVREHPFPENEYEADYLRKHMERYRDSCDIVAANCSPDGPLLGIGCEPGHVELLLKEYYGFRRISGLSYRSSPEFTRRMAAFDIPMLECDVENAPIPNPDGSFDSVVFLEVLEHMFNGVPFALSEMRRVLRPGGVLVLSTPNLAQFRNRIKLLKGKSVNWPLDGSKDFFGKPVHLRHNREYTAKEVCFLLTRAGFVIEKVRYGEYSPKRPRLMRIFNSLYPTFKSLIFVVARRK